MSGAELGKWLARAAPYSPDDVYAFVSDLLVRESGYGSKLLQVSPAFFKIMCEKFSIMCEKFSPKIHWAPGDTLTYNVQGVAGNRSIELGQRDDLEDGEYATSRSAK